MKTCMKCNGSGLLRRNYVNAEKKYVFHKEKCETCNGTGVDRTLHLFLTGHWFDLTEQDKKPVEYRRMGTRLEKRILAAKPGDLVAYHRGYTSNVCVRRITKIDTGPCPIEGWTGDFYRIHSERIEK